MSDELNRKTVSAMSWNGMQWLLGQCIHFVVGIVLARLLLPEKFGLIGIAAIFMGLGRIFADSGLGMALIQRKTPSHRDCCTIFYFNIAVGLAAAGLLCLAAPGIAAFFREPILTPLVRFLSLYIVFAAGSVVQSSLLSSMLNFRLLGIAGVMSGLGAGLIAIAMAMRGFGVWSLAVQQVSSGLISTVLLWLFNRWRPTLEFSLSALREMFGFASKLLAIGLIDVVFGNLYSVVIGRAFSPSALGLYTKSQSLTQLPAQGLTGVAGGVLFPAFSSIQDDRPRMKRGLRKAVVILSVIVFPMMVGVAMIARPLVAFLLGDTWLPCVPLVRLLCGIGLFYPLMEVNVRPLQAIGRSDLLLRLELFKKLMLVANVAITWRWGVAALVAGQLVHTAAAYALNAFYVGRHLAYPLREQLRDIAPILGATLIMGLAVLAIGTFFTFPHPGWQVLAQAGTGVALFWALGKTARFNGFQETLTILGQLAKRIGGRVFRAAA